MSSLWTPGGEHNVPRDPEPAVGAPTGLEPEMEDAIAASLPDGITLDDLSPEQLAQAEEAIREMAAVREQVLSAPAGDVIANHAMGLFELGALHLSQQTPTSPKPVSPSTPWRHSSTGSAIVSVRPCPHCRRGSSNCG